MNNLQRRAGTSVHANNGNNEPLCPTGNARAANKPMNIVDLPVDCGSCIAVTAQNNSFIHGIDPADILSDMTSDIVSERSSTYNVTFAHGDDSFAVTVDAGDYVTAVESARKRVTVSVQEVTTVTRIVEL